MYSESIRLEEFFSWDIVFRRHKKSHWLQTVRYEEIDFVTLGKELVDGVFAGRASFLCYTLEKKDRACLYVPSIAKNMDCYVQYLGFYYSATENKEFNHKNNFAIELRSENLQEKQLILVGCINTVLHQLNALFI
jgi:hypothetical protein